MCFPFSSGKGETHKQFGPHPFPGQSREVVHVYWFFSLPKSPTCVESSWHKLMVDQDCRMEWPKPGLVDCEFGAHLSVFPRKNNKNTGFTQFLESGHESSLNLISALVRVG